jgi:prolyl-tRNA synthetase
VALLAVNPKNSDPVTAAVEKLYLELCQAGIEVLFDDRDARPGVKFAEIDLLGITHRLVVGERGLRDGMVEYRHRRTRAEQKVNLNDVVAFVQGRLESCAGR